MQVTYEDVATFINTANAWLKKENNAKTKLGYAVQRMKPRAEKAWQKYQNELEDLNIEHCVTDEKGVIVTDDAGRYKFTKDEMKALRKEQQKLIETKVEIEPYIATEIPPDLSIPEILAFSNFVLSEDEIEKVEERMEEGKATAATVN